MEMGKNDFQTFKTSEEKFVKAAGSIENAVESVFEMDNLDNSVGNISLEGKELSAENEEVLDATTTFKPKLINKKRKKSRSTDTKVLEKIELRNKLTVKFACRWSDDGRVSVVTDEGIYVLKLQYNMGSLNTFFTFKKQFLRHSDYIPSRDYDLNINSFIEDLPRDEYYEAVLRLDISSNLNYCSSVSPSPVVAKWSPKGLIKLNHYSCIIASLSVLGALEIFSCAVNEYEMESYVNIANVTKQCVEVFHVNRENVGCLSAREMYKQLKLRSEQIIPTEFAWSDLYISGDKNFCVLFVGHRDGGISAWRFDGREFYTTNERVFYMGYKKTSFKQMTAMCWCESVLFIGNAEGKFALLPVNIISEDSVEIGEEFFLWPEADDIQVDHVDFVCWKNWHLITAVKNDNLIIYLLLNKKYVDMTIFRAGNIHITDILHYEENKILVTTMTGISHMITINIENNKLHLENTLFIVDIPWTVYKCHGVFASQNRVFFGFLANFCRQKEMARRNEFVIIYMARNLLKNPLQLLLDESLGSLINHWDCLEILRIKAAIEKEHPCKGLKKMNYDNLSLNQLKTLMFISQICEVLFHRILYLVDYLYIKPFSQMRKIVTMKMAILRLRKLLYLYNSKKASEFQVQNMCLLNYYLKMCVLSKDILTCELGNNIVNEISELMFQANKIIYPQMPRCIFCKDVISNRCLSSHYDMRCAISRMPITDVCFYKCPFCLCIVSKEMEKECLQIFCPYCDILMYKREFQDLTGSVTSKVLSETSLSECYDDCVDDTIDIADVDDAMALWSEGNGVCILSDDSLTEEEINKKPLVKRIIQFEHKYEENIQTVEIIESELTDLL